MLSLTEKRKPNEIPAILHPVWHFVTLVDLTSILVLSSPVPHAVIHGSNNNSNMQLLMCHVSVSKNDESQVQMTNRRQ